MQEDEQITSQPGNDRLPTSQQQHPLVPAAAHAGRALSLDVRDGDRSGGEDELNLRQYWQVLLKRKWTVLAAFSIVFFTVLVATLLMTPIYRASTTIQIDLDTVKVVQVQGMDAVAGNDDTFYKTQYELLQSPALSQRVASQLHLANDPTYQHLQDASPLSKLKAMLIPGKKPNKVTLASDADSAALGDFVNGNLDIDPVDGTRLVAINFDSPNAVLSAKVANAIADNFIAANLEHTFNASAYARRFLEGRLAQLKQKLSESESQLITIATQEKLFLGADGKTSLTSQNLSDLNSAMSQAQDVRLRAEARWKLARTTANSALPGDMTSSSIVSTLRQSRAQLMTQYQDKLGTYKPGYPLMQSIKSQIDELDKEIADEYSGVKSSAKTEYTAAVAHEALLQKQMDDLKNQVLDQEHRSITYNVAQRDVNTNQQLYDGLLQRYKEIGIAGGITNNNMSVVDRAAVPGGPYKPDLKKNLLLASLFGLGLGVMLAFSFEYLDDTLKNPDDIEKLLGLAVLGVIPRLKGMTPSEALKDPRSAFAEAYRSVRTALQFSTGSGVPRSLLVTSATPAEGKSTTALTLALNFAQLGKRVLLIDADLRNPSLHRTLGIENSNGLSNFLSGAIKPQDAIQSVPDTTLQVMTSGPLPPNPAELLAGPKMLSLLTVAIAKYDQVIIDGPPTIGIADAPIIAHIAIGTLLVVDAGNTRRDVARGAVKRLTSSRARLIGALMTKYDPKADGYSYGYGGYSYYAYGGEQPKLTQQ